MALDDLQDSEQAPDDGTDLDFGEPQAPQEPAEPTEPPFPIAEHFWLQYPYFSNEFAAEVVERFSDHIDWWNDSAYGHCVLSAYRAYHLLEGGVGEDPQISIEEAGESGELLSMSIGTYRSMVKHQAALVTTERPAWQPQARTSDAEARKQVPMVENLLDYVMSAGLVKQLSDQYEMGQPGGAGFMVLGWDATAGLNKQGWLTSRVLAPWEVCHEKVRDYDNDTTWWIYRAFESRWKWVARFAQTDPEKARAIYALDQSTEPFGISPVDNSTSDLVESGGDRIAVLYVLAKPTLACPLGRLACVASDGLVLEDVPLPYGDDVPITRLCEAEFVGTSIPFSNSWMLLAPSEAINAVVSTLITRVDMFGIPNVSYSAGTEFLAGDIAGANALEHLPGSQPPQALDLLKLPPELMEAASMLNKMVEQLSGINGVTRGQPADNITSGSMAALMQSMAVQYNNTGERAWVMNLERVATLIVKIFQRMASKEVLISVCGQDNAYTATNFKKEDLSSILRVTVKVSAPMLKTQAGRAQIADVLMQNKECTGAEYMTVLQTGQLESTFKGPVSTLGLIKSENEAMLRGEAPVVSDFDNDQLHMREHAAELDSDVRANIPIATAFLKHLGEHLQSWSTKSRENPDLLAALGQPPLPQAAGIGDQGRQMQQQHMGMPPAPPPQRPPAPPPQQQSQPNTAPPPKASPGPAKSAVPGQEPSQAAPKMPMPAKTPDGQSVA